MIDGHATSAWTHAEEEARLARKVADEDRAARPSADVQRSRGSTPAMNKWFAGTLFFFVLCLLAGHAVWPDTVTLDGWMAILLVIAVIVVFAPILASAEIPGLASLRFRQQLKEGQEVSEEVERETAVAIDAARHEAPVAPSLPPAVAAPSDRAAVAEETPGEGDGRGERIPDVQNALDLVPISDDLRDLVPREPELALAGLRIAVERGVRAALSVLAPEQSPQSTRLPLGRAVRRLSDASAMTDAQAQLLLVIVDLCQKAVHGQKVYAEDAAHVFDMADTLNHTFALGYSLKLQPNPQWHEQGLMCEYEHCIEHMPLDPVRGDVSCPLFGHDCPGGVDRVASCNTADDYQ